MPNTPPPSNDTAPADPAEAELVAYLDGELDKAAARRVAAKLAADPQLRGRAAALKKTFDLLDFLPKPEPSPTFTTRTLEKLPAVKSAAVPVSTPSIPAAAVSEPLPVAAPRSRGWAAGVLVGGILAVLVGYGGTAAVRPLLFPPPQVPDSPALSLDDLRMIERLPLYAVADDLEFVARLLDPELFGDDPSVAFDGPLPPPSVDVVDKPTAAEHDALVKAFKALPADRQAAVRLLHRQLTEKPPPVRDRLFRVLEAYAAWLGRLPDAERRGVLAAGTPGLRLDIVRQVRERQWVAALPDAQRKQLDGQTPAAWSALVGAWRDEAAAARSTWTFARRHWEINRADRAPWPFDDEARKREVVEFVRHAYRTDDPKKTRLQPGEFERLKEAHDGGVWLWYGKLAFDASKKYEVLPEPAHGHPVTQFADLWKEAEDYYKRADTKKVAAGKKRAAAAAVGKWPDFALAVKDDLTLTKFAPPSTSAYGPCKPADFKEPLRQFVAELERKWPGEWKAVAAQEGRWPDYPRAIAKMAAAHDLSVPGVTLPGPPSQWERIYNPPRGGR